MIQRLIFFIFFLLSLSLWSQGYRHFTIEDGLPSNRIYKVLQDSTGFIWIATDNGLVRFDGVRFKVFNSSNGLPVNDIWEMAVDTRNRLWFITNASGLGFIKNDSVYVFYAKDNQNFNPLYYNVSDTTVGFKNADGKYYIWTGNEWKISRQHLFKDNYQLIHPNFGGIGRDKHHLDRWFIMNKNGDTIPLNIKISGRYLFVNQVSGDIFTLSDYQKLAVVRLDSLFANTLEIDSLFENFPRGIPSRAGLQWTSGNAWLLTDKNGKIKDWKRFEKVDEAHGVFQDRQGNFWVYTFGNGLWFFPKANPELARFLVNRKVHFAKKIGDKIFVHILDDGVYQWNPTSAEFHKVLPYKGYVYNIFSGPDNSIYVLGSTRLFIRRRNHWTEFENWYGINGIGLGKHLYFSMKSHVLKTDNFLQTVDTLSLSNVVMFRNTPLGLLAATNRGLFHIKGDKFFPVFAQKLSIMPIKDIRVKKNNTYVLTENGKIYRISMPGELYELKIEGMRGPIGTMAFDREGKLWIGGEKGLQVFVPDENDNYRFLYGFHKMHGLTSEQVTGILLDSLHVWVSSYNGIVRFPARMKPPRELEHLYLRFIEYGGHKQKQDKWKFQPKSRLRIGFGIVDYMHPEHVQLYYRMMPDGHWHHATSDEVSFERLIPGNYRFELKALAPDGTRKHLAYDFSILPLWWQTTTTRLLFGVLMAFMLLFTGNWIRKKQSQRRYELLIREKQWAEAELAALRSRMNPHFIFNALNSILYHIEKKEYRLSEKYLVKFSQLVRKIFELSAVKTVELEKEIQFITDYLEMEKLRFKDRLSYCIDIAPEVKLTTKIPSMLLQPLVENALQHGLFHKKGKGHVCIEIRKSGQKGLEIRVKDDGIGIKRAEAMKKHTLGNHLSRATRILQGRINLINKSGKWKINMQMHDRTQNENETYNTIVTLKIEPHDQSHHH